MNEDETKETSSQENDVFPEEDFAKGDSADVVKEVEKKEAENATQETYQTAPQPGKSSFLKYSRIISGMKYVFADFKLRRFMYVYLILLQPSKGFHNLLPNCIILYMYI